MQSQPVLPECVVRCAQNAIFLLRGEHGSGYTPPAVGASTGFNDVASTDFAAEGITGGGTPTAYCPDTPVTRDQMAIFLVNTFNLP